MAGNIREAKEKVCKAVCKNIHVYADGTTSQNGPDEPVDIFGWSRGAVQANTLAKRLEDEGCECCNDVERYIAIFECISIPYSSTACATKKPIPVRFLGMVEPVPLALIGISKLYFHDIPSNVQNAAAAYVLGGTWLGFLFFPHVVLPASSKNTNLVEQFFDGVHEHSGFDPDIEDFIVKQAKKAGVPF